MDDPIKPAERRESGPALFERLVADAARLASGPRRLLGIAGPPGAGKTTLARDLVAALGGPPAAALAPMDGFHLANVELARLGRADRKGAPDTFDADGFVALLRRLREPRETVYAPAFEHALGEPIAGAIAIDPATRLVVIEGNYLALDRAPWRAVPPLVDELWLLVAPLEALRDRLVARHVRVGREPADAAAWVDRNDLANARAVLADRDRATRVVPSLELERPGPAAGR